jgi:hypothetical protein
MSHQNIINPKPCNYNCGTRIYWDASSNSYLEVFTKQKHICKNRSASTQRTDHTLPFYSKKSYQKHANMSNSLELISGSVSEVQQRYEILSDIVNEFNGKVHGSQSHVNENIVSLVVYYEVPEGKRVEVKNRYNSLIKTIREKVYKINI